MNQRRHHKYCLRGHIKYGWMWFISYHSSLRKQWVKNDFAVLFLAVWFSTMRGNKWKRDLLYVTLWRSGESRATLQQNIERSTHNNASSGAANALLLLQEWTSLSLLSLPQFVLRWPSVVPHAECIGSCWSVVFGLKYWNLFPPAGCSWSIYDGCQVTGQTQWMQHVSLSFCCPPVSSMNITGDAGVTHHFLKNEFFLLVLYES